MDAVDYPFGVRVKFGDRVELIQLDWNNIAPESFINQGKFYLQTAAYGNVLQDLENMCLNSHFSIQCKNRSRNCTCVQNG